MRVAVTLGLLSEAELNHVERITGPDPGDAPTAADRARAANIERHVRSVIPMTLPNDPPNGL